MSKKNPKTHICGRLSVLTFCSNSDALNTPQQHQPQRTPVFTGERTHYGQLPYPSWRAYWRVSDHQELTFGNKWHSDQLGKLIIRENEQGPFMKQSAEVSLGHGNTSDAIPFLCTRPVCPTAQTRLPPYAERGILNKVRKITCIKLSNWSKF